MLTFQICIQIILWYVIIRVRAIDTGKLTVDYNDDEEEYSNHSDSKEISELSPPIITHIKDIERLARFLLLRGHIVLDASHVVRVNESRIERLIDYLHNLQLYKGKKRISPMEDRELGCDQIENQNSKTKILCDAASYECLSSRKFLQLIQEKSIGIGFHQIIARLCPLLLLRQMKPICYEDAIKSQHDNQDNKLKLVEPKIEKVWGFGVLFVTLSILVSLGGLIVVPFLKKDARRLILNLFEGLAVGGLAGSAIFHLFPQAFNIVEEKYRLYFWRTFLIFGGIYMFYFFEMGIKIFTTIKLKGKRKRVTPLQREEEVQRDTLLNATHVGHKPPTNTDPISILQTYEQRMRSNSNSVNQALINSTREQLVQCLASVNVAPVSPLQIVPDISVNDQISAVPSKEEYVPAVNLQRKDQDSSLTMNIDTVAWMIVLGDALLNFIDGLSIGAAFDRNILAGISISIAVMLEEVTHRLGTFAVLIRAGMKMKQSFLYIFISACACYPGLVLGIILADEAEDASPYIFALAGGFFLYMALVDVMQAMNTSMENASRKGVKSMLRILALQNIGIIISIIFLALLAFYEREMDFERVELEEIADNSIE